MREVDEDEYNSIGATTLTGISVKSTAGLGPIAIAGGLVAVIVTVNHLGDKIWNSRGHSISTPNWA